MDATTDRSELADMITKVIEEYGKNQPFLSPDQVREFLDDTYEGMDLPPMNNKEFDDFMFAVDENKDGVIEHQELLDAFEPMLQNIQLKNLQNEIQAKIITPVMEKPNFKAGKEKGSNNNFISGLGAHIRKFERKKQLHTILLKGNEEAKNKLEQLATCIATVGDQNIDSLGGSKFKTPLGIFFFC